MIIGGSII